MPKCGIHVINCDIPIRIDSYTGCSYACGYCSERIQGRGSKRAGLYHDGVRSLRRFIAGFRGNTTSWCDWGIPLH